MHAHKVWVKWEGPCLSIKPVARMGMATASLKNIFKLSRKKKSVLSLGSREPICRGLHSLCPHSAKPCWTSHMDWWTLIWPECWTLPSYNMKRKLWALALFLTLLKSQLPLSQSGWGRKDISQWDNSRNVNSMPIKCFSASILPSES